MARLINAEKMGFFACPTSVVELISRWLSAGKQAVRLLDPCAGEGKALAQLAASLQTQGAVTETWGVELSPARAREADQVLDRVFNTAWQSTRVSKESIGLLYLNPPYDHDLDGDNHRLESEFLRTSLPVLQKQGVLVYVVPQHILGFKAVARLLVEYFDQLTVRRFPDPEFERFGQIVVFGRRRSSPLAVSEEEIEALRLLRDADLPPLGDPAAGWPLAIPSATSNATFYRIDRSAAEDIQTAGALPWSASLLEAFKPQTAQVVEPPLPLKKGHVAMLMSSGVMGAMVIEQHGRRHLIKGRVLKVQDHSESLTDEGDTVTTIKDRFITSVGRLSADGVQVIQDDVAGLTDFMEEYGEAIAGKILANQPRYDLHPTDAEWTHVEGLGKGRAALPGQKPGLLDVQKHAAIALTRTLKCKGYSLMQGEMGLGKTTIGAATIDLIGAYPAIVLCPPHLVDKWCREITEVIPGAQAREIRRIGKGENGVDINDVRSFLNDFHAGRLGPKAVAVVSETSAKLGSGWTRGVATRYTLSQIRPGEYVEPAVLEGITGQRNRFKAALAAYQAARAQLLRSEAPTAELRRHVAMLRKAALETADAYPVCPDCGSREHFVHGNGFLYYEEQPRACDHFVPGWERDAQGRKVLNDAGLPTWIWSRPDDLKAPYPACGGRLYQFAGHGTLRRWSIADYIRTHTPRAFKTLVADECHNYRGKGSDRGRAFHHLVKATRYALGMTGTIYGGEATSVFYLLGRLNPAIFRDYPFGAEGEKRWARQYGVLETKVYNGKEADPDEAEHGGFSARKRSKVVVTEKPGVSPAILSQFVDWSIFLGLKDLGITLPDYDEIAKGVSLGSELYQQYRKMESILRALGRKDMGYLSLWLQWSLSRPNSAFRDEEVVKKEFVKVGRKQQLAGEVQLMELPAVVAGEAVLPKEQALIDFCLSEKQQGRKVIVFVRQTGVRDIQDRIAAVLKARDLQVTVLRGSVDPRKRETWIDQRVDGMDVLICNPRLVETGLDLIKFASIVFYEIQYDLYCVWQAMRRVWRLGQRKPVKVLFLTYEGTIEDTALRLVGRKMKAAQLMYGDEVGGAIVPDDDGDSFLMELARTVLEDTALPDLSGLFASARAQASTEALPEEIAEILETVAPKGPLTWAMLQEMVKTAEKPRRRPSKPAPAPTGQMLLFELAPASA